MERQTSHLRASCSLRTVSIRPAWAGRLPRRRCACPALASQPGDNASTSKIIRTLDADAAPPEPAQKEQGANVLPDVSQESAEGSSSKPAGPLFALASGLGIVLLLAGGYMFKDQIKAFLDYFIDMVDQFGPWGYAAYAGVYVVLELLALPAIPLTMTAGIIFGTNQGTVVVSLASTAAATLAFLIARYLARDRVRGFAYKHPKFKAIDRAIGKNGLKFVTLLRLSPLLPFAASNYLYGLTSVDLGSYVLGSWVGMLPGTYAYVHAGALGRAVLDGGEGSVAIDSWQVVLGLSATLLALGFIGKLAKNAVEEADAPDTPTTAPTTPSPSPPPQKGTTPSA